MHMHQGNKHMQVKSYWQGGYNFRPPTYLHMNWYGLTTLYNCNHFTNKQHFECFAEHMHLLVFKCMCLMVSADIVLMCICFIL